jgi:flagellar protein FlgJ
MRPVGDASAIGLAADEKSVADLKRVAREDPKAAIRETARQFEALLLNVMIKSMRESTGQDGIFDSEQTRLYTSLLDQQLSQAMSRRGMGIAGMLERQLSPAPPDRPPQERVLNATAPGQGLPGPGDIRGFVEKLQPEADKVSRETGIPARFLLGHAALESGWGRAEIRHEDGSASHNLFGVKAGGGWRGRTVDSTTTEFIDGVAQKRVEAFRAYDSYAEAFRDYANLLQSQPRYAQALQSTGDARAYARELQRAGYATDPLYADKLAAVIDGQRLRISMTA